MALRQKLATFLETRDLKELKDTAVDVLFEFVRGELKGTRLWKFLAVTELIRNQYQIRVPNSVDTEYGNYAEKTQYLRNTERDLAEKLMHALEFRARTLLSPIKEWKGNDGWKNMELTPYLNPHVLMLNYWINYQGYCPEKGTFVNGDGYSGFQYEGYEVQMNCDFILKYELP